MLKCWLCLPLLVGLALGFLALSQTTGDAAQDKDRIGELVKQLGSSKYAERERAKKELESIGLPALEQLRKASQDGDLETRQRCQELVKKFEGKLAADDLIAPKKVKLSFKDTPVMQAIEELQRQSGYQITVEGDRVPLAKRLITLETGEVTFWEAFDKLCQAAKLAEIPTGGSRPNIIYYELDNVIQILPVNKQLPPMPAMPPAQPAVAPQPVPPPPPLKGGAQPVPLDRQLVDPMPKKGMPKNEEQEIALQVQNDLPAAAGNGQAVGGQVVIPPQAGQAGQPGQPGQAGAVGGAVQIKPGVVQIQPMPPQAGQVQPLPALQLRPLKSKAAPSRVYQPGSIVVRDGTPDSVPTSYYGALRIRLLPASKATEVIVQPTKKGEVVYILEVTAEPRLQQFSVVGSARLDKALDDQGQDLAMALEPLPEGGGHGGPTAVIGRVTTYVPYAYAQPRQVALRLKLGEKQAKSLKDLKGVLSVQALNATPEALISVGDIMKAEGKVVRGSTGGLIEVVKIEKLKNGSYSIKYRFEQPPQFYPATTANTATPAAGGNGRGAGGGGAGGGGGKGGLAAQAIQIQIQPAGNATTSSSMFSGNQGLPVLVDAKGKALAMQATQQSRAMSNNGVVTYEHTCVFRPDNGAGEPTQFVLFGHRMVTAQVPFAFEGIKLP